MARLVELALVVPVEVSSRLIEAVPAVVDKVPAAADRVKREVVLARFLGKMVVDQGVRELRARLTPPETPVPTAPAAKGGTPPQVAPEPEPEPEADVEAESDAKSDAKSDDGAPDVSSLALADYDHLSSAQIVGKLDGLTATERHTIERYERAGRRRRTILGKLAQLEERA